MRLEGLEKLQQKKDTEALLALVKDNPDLPIICMVDCDVVAEDSGRWLGVFGSVCVGEYAEYDERIYDDRDDFKERYYEVNDEELEERFGYNPCITDFAVEVGRYTQEEFEKNLEAEAKVNAYLDEVCEREFTKAIIVNVDLP